MANSLFGMMNASSTGLMTSQIGINTASNNIQNSQTDGYTRQRVNFNSSLSIYYKGTGYLGTGVDVSQIQRLRDSYLDVQIRDETSVYGQETAKQQVLETLESVIAEPSDVGLNVNMDNLWDAWSELAKNPGNSTLQILVKENSKVVAEKLNELTIKINNVATEASDRKNSAITEASDLITEINTLNAKLKRMYENDPTAQPNELLDKRDLLTKKLSETMGVNVTANNDMTVSVEVRLNDGTTVDALALDRQGVADLTEKLSSGSIKGFYEAETELTTKYKKEFGKFAETLANEINGIQGFDFFQYDANDPSGTIKVNPGLLDGTLEIKANNTGNMNDNTLILDILALRDKTVSIGGQNTTFGQFYKDIVANIGVETKQAANNAENQLTVLHHLDARYESLSGINIDEEMINLTQFQSAYDANARVISTITEMLDTILNMGV